MRRIPGLLDSTLVELQIIAQGQSADVRCLFKTLDLSDLEVRISGIVRLSVEYSSDLSFFYIVSHYKLLCSPGRVYLSLEPYLEDALEDERDEFVIIGTAITP